MTEGTALTISHGRVICSIMSPFSLTDPSVYSDAIAALESLQKKVQTYMPACEYKPIPQDRNPINKYFDGGLFVLNLEQELSIATSTQILKIREHMLPDRCPEEIQFKIWSNNVPDYVSDMLNNFRCMMCSVGSIRRGLAGAGLGNALQMLDEHIAKSG